MKDNVAGKLRRYTNTTLHEHDVVLADRIGSVASENRDRQFFVLGWLKTSQSLMSNAAMIIDDNNVVVVGAGLVPAHDVVLSDDGSIVGASDHDVVPVNTRATTRVAPTLGHVIGTYKSLVAI